MTIVEWLFRFEHHWDIYIFGCFSGVLATIGGLKLGGVL